MALSPPQLNQEQPNFVMSFTSSSIDIFKVSLTLLINMMEKNYSHWILEIEEWGTIDLDYLKYLRGKYQKVKKIGDNKVDVSLKEIIHLYISLEVSARFINTSDENKTLLRKVTGDNDHDITLEEFVKKARELIDAFKVLCKKWKDFNDYVKAVKVLTFD